MFFYLALWSFLEGGFGRQLGNSGPWHFNVGNENRMYFWENKWCLDIFWKENFHILLLTAHDKQAIVAVCMEVLCVVWGLVYGSLSHLYRISTFHIGRSKIKELERDSHSPPEERTKDKKMGIPGK